MNKKEALKFVKRIAQSYVGSCNPHVVPSNFPNKDEEWRFIFRIVGKSGKRVGYGIGTITKGGTGFTSTVSYRDLALIEEFKDEPTGKIINKDY